MIDDIDIEKALKELANNPTNSFQFEYKPPVADSSSHGLNFENNDVLGTFAIWPSGALEWTIYEIETEKEIAGGGKTVNSVSAIKDTLTEIFKSPRNFVRTYSKKFIESKLTSLNQKGQIAFGAACCERMIPNYSAFSQEYEWGDPSILRNSLDQIWSHIEGNNLANEKIETLSTLCENCAPDLDDFGSSLAGHAQNAALSICAVFDYLLTIESERIAQVSAFSVDTVDSHVQEIESMSPSDSNLEQKIRNHPLMDAEINWQYSALNYLNGKWTAQDAKSMWSQVISNIGLPK